MNSTTLTLRVAASRAEIFPALVDADALATWRVPDGMTSTVHEFDPREGGRFRVTLTYTSADEAGKSGAHSDTYAGRFVRIVPDEQVVEEFAFETDDPALRGTMLMTTTLTDAADGGTDVTIAHENLPPGLSLADNETGTRMALQHLDRYVRNRA